MRTMSPLLAVWLIASAAEPSLKIDGDGVTATTLSGAQLEALGSVTATWNDKKGAHQVKGVRLDKVLAKAGFIEGASGPKVDPKVKHAGLRTAVVASAPDGFVTVFSAGELLESVGATQALVIWELDGKPLDAATGPLRIVVTTDREPSRSIYQLAALKLVSLAK
jgi:hypothetical protein